MNKTIKHALGALAVLAIVAGVHTASYATEYHKPPARPNQHPTMYMYNQGWNQGMKFQQELDQRLNGRLEQRQGQHQNASSYSESAGYSFNHLEGNRTDLRVQGGATYNTDHDTAYNTSTYHDNSKDLTIIPVNVQAPPSINPTANVSRMVGGECGPQMKILIRPVYGINNRFFGSEKVELGSDDTLISANQPYREITLPNGDKQLIGHRIVETTAAINTSSAYGFGAGGNSSSGSAGSLGVSSSGAMQRLVTSIRLVDCVAYTVKKAPERVVKPSQPVRKGYTKPRPIQRPVSRSMAPVRRIDPACGCVVNVNAGR